MDRAGTRWARRGWVLCFATAVRSRHSGWLAAWNTMTIHAARPNITKIGITMRARSDPVMAGASFGVLFLVPGSGFLRPPGSGEWLMNP